MCELKKYLRRKICLNTINFEFHLLIFFKKRFACVFDNYRNQTRKS